VTELGDPGGAVEASDVVVVFVTAPSEDVASALAKSVVGAGLAACVNIVPGLRSVYRWQGEVHDEPELLLIMKTRRDREEALKQHVLVAHPYDVPEFLVVPSIGGSAEYLDWVRTSVT
jgi:periplasmic divalent cation tolerance protein